MKRLLTRFWWPTYTRAVVYMLQNTDYEARRFWQWYVRVADWREVMRHGDLEPTRAARFILALFTALQLMIYAYIPAAWWLIETNSTTEVIFKIIYLALWFIAAPLIAVGLLLAVLALARLLIQKPLYWWRVRQARQLLARHPATKIGIAGSYGKTTMKYILTAVLGSRKKVAATQGNYNTSIGLARFARSLKGDEDILILEYGEYRPGDVERLARLSPPSIGVITGVNEQHMMRMGSIDNALATVFELDDVMGPEGLLYVNGESAHVERRLSTHHVTYSRDGCAGWKVEKAKSDLHGTSFTAKQGKRTVKIITPLLGLHQIGPLVCALALADRLGVSTTDITRAAAALTPPKLRFEPQLIGGATVIYDIYNGNPAGFLAGIDFLDQLPKTQAKRRVYVTPGIIELGGEAERIHREIGERLADSRIDEIVLVRNRVTDWLREGLESGGYKGRLREIDDGPAFYGQIETFVGQGDVVLLQNSPRETFFYSQK